MRNSIEFLSFENRNDLLKIIKIVVSELEWELSIRTGYSDNEYMEVLKKLTTDDANICLSNDDLSMLHQALNEFYHGFDNSKWESLISMNKTTGEALMDKIKLLIK